MTNNIYPPDHLLRKWEELIIDEEQNVDVVLYEAFQAGADQELEACCEWLFSSLPGYDKHYADYLRAARRPKPPSLKELNLKHLEVMERDGHYLPEIIADLRRAIESLPS
jgi:hypothetical protein